MSYIDKYLEDLEIKYTREIELKPDKHVKFFATITLLIYLAFGVLGIRPTLVGYFQKVEFLEQLRETNSNLEAKIVQLEDARVDLQKVEKEKRALDLIVPVEPEIEEFLDEIVILSAKRGYILNRLTPSTLEGGTINIIAQFTGNPANFSQLIDDLENTQRISTVSEVTFIPREGEATVSVKLDIYYSEIQS